jgi:hypothetical protein
MHPQIWPHALWRTNLRTAAKLRNHPIKILLNQLFIKVQGVGLEVSGKLLFRALKISLSRQTNFTLLKIRIFQKHL